MLETIRRVTSARALGINLMTNYGGHRPTTGRGGAFIRRRRARMTALLTGVVNGIEPEEA